MRPNDYERRGRPSRAKSWTALSILLVIVLISAVFVLYGNFIRMNCESSSVGDFVADVTDFHTSEGC